MMNIHCHTKHRSLRAALMLFGGSLLLAACSGGRSPYAGTCFGATCEFGPASNAIATSY